MRFVTKRVWKVRIDGGLTYGAGDKSPTWKDGEAPIDFYFEDGAMIDGVLRDIRESFAASFSKVPGSITFRQGESGWTVIHEHIGQIAYVSTLDYPVAPLNRPTHF
jgi:hypothetical protein